MSCGGTWDEVGRCIGYEVVAETTADTWSNLEFVTGHEQYAATVILHALSSKPRQSHALGLFDVIHREITSRDWLSGYTCGPCSTFTTYLGKGHPSWT